MPPYDIHHAGINVRDMKRSEEFYALFGFQRVRAFQAGGREFVLLGNGSAHIELFPAEGPDAADRGPRTRGFRHICLRSEDVQCDFERLRGIVEVVKPPFRHENLLVAFIKDPDGVEIELYQET